LFYNQRLIDKFDTIGDFHCETIAYLKYAIVTYMPLHLIGENIDKMRGHHQTEAGKLVHLVRGIYVDANDDIDQTIRTHAVRIAKYLYPNAYLSAASAVLLGPMRDGRLFLTGRRVQRQRIRMLGPGRGDIQDMFEQNLARIFATVGSRLPTVVRKHHCPRAN